MPIYTYPKQICYDCGIKNGASPHEDTLYHHGVCDICGENFRVTDAGAFAPLKLTPYTEECLWCGTEYTQWVRSRNHRTTYCSRDCLRRNIKDKNSRAKLQRTRAKLEMSRGQTCFREYVRCKHYAAGWLTEPDFFCKCKGYEPEPERPLMAKTSINLDVSTTYRVNISSGGRRNNSY